MSAAAPRPAGAAVRVWDPLVRLAHWALALSVIAAFATGDDGGKWHERLGYGALAIVALRLLWGFVGPLHARFADFVRGPGAVAAYARALVAGREPRYLGHNPLGGAWIVLMLSLVVATGGTGVALSILGEEGHHWLEELHEGLANGIVAAVAVHLAGVAWESLRHGENLVRSMLNGRKRALGPGEG